MSPLNLDPEQAEKLTHLLDKSKRRKDRQKMVRLCMPLGLLLLLTELRSFFEVQLGKGERVVGY